MYQITVEKPNSRGFPEETPLDTVKHMGTAITIANNVRKQGVKCFITDLETGVRYRLKPRKKNKIVVDKQ